MTKRLVLYFLRVMFLFLISPCCKNENDSHRNIPFIRDVPKDKNGRESVFESITPIRDSLKLDYLDKGYDSLEIRIWIGGAMSLNQQVIIIKNQKGNWSATFINFQPVFHDNYKMDSLLYFETKKVSKYPKLPWNELIDSLKRYQVLTLPDQDKLPKYGDSMDGKGFVFEISTKNEYRLYTYHNPQVNLDIPEAKNVTNILNLIKNSFDIQLL